MYLSLVFLQNTWISGKFVLTLHYYGKFITYQFTTKMCH